MEFSAGTFVWMRDVGAMATNHVVAGSKKGMVALTPHGLTHLLNAQGVVHMLHHYCCSRFDIPEDLVAEEGDTLAVRRANWGIAAKILKDALQYDLTWERRELICQGDVVEVIVLLKQLQDLMKNHRLHDRLQKLKHRVMNEDAHTHYVAGLLASDWDSLKHRPLRNPHEHDKPWTRGMVLDEKTGKPKQLPPIEPPKPPRKSRFIGGRVRHADESEGDGTVERRRAVSVPPPPARHLSVADL